MSLFYRMTWIAFVLSVAMTILSAWIRLADSGIGCAPWPTCFREQFVVDPEPGIAIAESDP
ncbi:MAG: heme A synthase, partial [Pseudomonadales bacterium]|nr:heme A synthase [Pseudomonadales bacterium]